MKDTFKTKGKDWYLYLYEEEHTYKIYEGKNIFTELTEIGTIVPINEFEEMVDNNEPIIFRMVFTYLGVQYIKYYDVNCDQEAITPIAIKRTKWLNGKIKNLIGTK